MRLNALPHAGGYTAGVGNKQIVICCVSLSITFTQVDAGTMGVHHHRKSSSYAIISIIISWISATAASHLNRYLKILDDVETVEHFEDNFKVDWVSEHVRDEVEAEEFVVDSSL